MSEMQVKRKLCRRTKYYTFGIRRT